MKVNEFSKAFPFSFIFFDRLLEQKSPFFWLNFLFILYSYFQLYLFSLTPIIIENRMNNTRFKNESSLIFALMTVNPKPFDMADSVFSYLIMILVIFIVFSSIFLMYFFFSHHHSIPDYLLQTKGLLFLYNPSVYFFIGLFSFGVIIVKYIERGYFSTVNIINIILSLIIIFSLDAFHRWISPILYGSCTRLDSSIIPCFIFHDYSLFYYRILYAVFIIATISFANNWSHLVFDIVSVFIGIIMFSIVLKKPSRSLTNFCFESSTTLIMTFGPLITTGLIKFTDIMPSLCIVDSLIIFVIGFIGSFLFMKNVEGNLRNMVHQNEVKKMKKYPIYYVANYALSHAVVTEEIYELVNRSMASEDFDIIIGFFKIYCAVYLHKSESSTFQIFLDATDLTPMCRFSLYELIRYHTKDMTDAEGDVVFNIQKLVFQYQKHYDQFWTNQMECNFNESIKESAEMARIIQKVNTLYVRYHTFYPQNPAILDLEQTFFSRVSPQLINNISKPVNEITSSHASSTSIWREKELISQKILKMLPRGFSGVFSVLSIFIVILFVTMMGVLNAKTFYLLSKRLEMLKVPQSLNKTMVTGVTWTQLYFALASITNCTSYVDMNEEQFYDRIQSESEPGEVELVKMMNVIQNIYDYTDLLLNNMRLLTNDMALMNSRSEIKDVWTKPSVLFNVEEDILLDVRSTMIFWLLNAQVRYENITGKGICNTPLADFYRERIYDFANQTSSILYKLYDLLSIYSDYVAQQKSTIFDFKSDPSTLYYAAIGIAVIILISSIILQFLEYYHLYYCLKVFFRHTYHPLHEGIIEPKEPKKFQIMLSYFSLCFIFTIVIVLFMFQFDFLRNAITSGFTRIMDTCALLVQTEQTALYTIFSLCNIFQYWQFQEIGYTMSESFGFNVFYSSSPAFAEKISAIYTNEKPENIPYEIQDIIDNNTNYTSIHDIYARWSLMKQISLQFFYISSMNLDHADFIDSAQFFHVQHIFLTHLIPDYESLATQFSQLAIESNDDLTKLNLYEVSMIIIFFFIFITILIYSNIKYHRTYQQINCIYSLLDPYYIASSENLMKYLLGDQVQPENPKTYTILRLLNDIEVPLLIVTSKNAIVGFTTPIKLMFNYREEQLIGQRLDLIIPRTEKTTRFYHNMKMMKAFKTEQHIEQNVDGLTSDGDVMQLEVSVTHVEYEQFSFFIVEIRSLMDIDYYEQFLQIHEDIFTEFISAEVPNFLLRDTQDSKNIISKHFDRYAVALCMYESPKISNNIISDIVQYKTGLSQCIPLFRGEQGAIVLYCSCSSALIVFIDLEGTDDYMAYALNFMMNYGGTDAIAKAGFIFSGEGIDVSLFPIAQVSNSSTSTGELSIEEAKDFVPSAIVEVMSPLIKYCPQIGSKLGKDTFIVGPEYLPYFSERAESAQQIQIAGLDLYMIRENVEEHY
ncbi:hypothetical protein TRFO_18870 [Tritrichomonas foetus]|uniref:PAS domain-containing protein n=1 Tax=Tritrichomonas foetus TaxID=1144522 RepID=A0A1J4KP88_9EUKA|nr:hypothetical protein TRFO_18870 [Tritrichomonas foetus]|eukprot:OHT11612.1 hypothetical protein TRFO_18870 [Tritrichomonas foetus]